MSFVQITDFHCVPGDDTLYGTSPKARLLAAIEQINRDHKDCSLVLITGDLVHEGSLEAYQTLRAILNDLELPFRLMVGNHDNRANLLKVFPMTPLMDDGGYIQYSLNDGNQRIICLDTKSDVPGDHSGHLGMNRLTWLDQEIAATPKDQELIVAAHHPFFDVGLPHMDDIKLQPMESAALLEIFERRKPDMFIFGHVHRTISGSYAGIPFHTQRGINHQVALNFNRQPAIEFSEEPAEFSIIKPVGKGVCAFVRTVAEPERRFPAD